MTDIGEGPRGGARGTAEPYQRTAQPLLLHIILLGGAQRHWRGQEAELPYLEFDLGPPPELGLDVEHFFQEQASRQGGDRGSGPSQEPLMEDYDRCIEWRGQMIATPTWWWELWEFGEFMGVSRGQQHPGTSPEDKSLFWAASTDERDR